MDAEQLRNLAGQQNLSSEPFWEALLKQGLTMQELEDWAENAFDEIFEFVEEVVSAFLEERAKQGHFQILLEPFSSLPGFMHKPPMEDLVMEALCEKLQRNGFITKWDRRDDRVLLTVEWGE